MRNVFRYVFLLLPAIGLILSFIFGQPSKAIQDTGTFISSSEHCPSNFHDWMATESLPSVPGEEVEDDDDDYAKDHSKLAHSSPLNSASDKHLFDHPSFDEESIQVATPPPKA